MSSHDVTHMLLLLVLSKLSYFQATMSIGIGEYLGYTTAVIFVGLAAWIFFKTGKDE